MPLVTTIRPVTSGVVNASGVSESSTTSDPGAPSRPHVRCARTSATDRRDTSATVEATTYARTTAPTTAAAAGTGVSCRSFAGDHGPNSAISEYCPTSVNAATPSANVLAAATRTLAGTSILVASAGCSRRAIPGAATAKRAASTRTATSAAIMKGPSRRRPGERRAAPHRPGTDCRESGSGRRSGPRRCRAIVASATP